MSYTDKAIKYAEQVVSGDVIACRYVKLSCQRFLNDLKKDWRWNYEVKQAEQVCWFIEHGIKHVKGELAGQFLKLEPWQCFILCNIYGWRDKDGTRRFQYVLLEIARKNGKTLFGAGLAIHEMLTGEEGGEIYSLATKMDQAKLAYEAAVQMLNKAHPDIKKQFKIVTNCISNHKKWSNYKPLGRDSKSLDGLNPSMCIFDETAAYSDRNIVEVMTSATGARKNFLHLFITTAQFSRTTIHYENRQYLLDVLEGRIDNDRWFGTVYTLDDGDDWRDESVWVKANPNLGVSVSIENLRNEVEQAKVVMSKRNGILVKNFNIYTSGEDSWIPLEDWQKCKSSVIKNGDLYVGVDLSTVKDLTALCYMWVNGDKFSVDFKCFIPRETYTDLPVHIKPKYDNAIETGVLHVTAGKSVDYREVLDHITETVKNYNLKMIGYDRYNAVHLVNELEDLGLPTSDIGQNMASLSAPSKETERLVMEELIRHDGNPFIDWQIECCSVYTDVNDNVKIKKDETDKSLKIDAVIALIMCVSMAAGRLDGPGDFNISFIELN